MKQNDTLNTLLDRGYEGAINFGSNGEISSISFWMSHDELETSEGDVMTDAIPVATIEYIMNHTYDDGIKRGLKTVLDWHKREKNG